MAQKTSEEMIETPAKNVCPYSSDCFKCPAPDCMVNRGWAERVNKLPYDLERANAAKGRKRRTKER